MKMILNHLSSSLPDLEDEEEIGKKIEDYLTRSGFHYAVNCPDTYLEGITVWFDYTAEVGSWKDKQIRKLSDLALFLFETLRLGKNCLHFVFREYIINGEGKFEVSWNAIDEIVFQEITSLPLPPELKAKTLSEFDDEWKNSGQPPF